jgi:hypothetical protein
MAAAVAQHAAERELFVAGELAAANDAAHAQRAALLARKLASRATAYLKRTTDDSRDPW